ncbi:MAG: sensor histidine kinase [Chitinophagaceae bacterium]|nr:MAG: sensor histidine kinase [Chitinophagaceae bacterium]
MAEPLTTQRKFYVAYMAYWVVWIIVQTSILEWFGLPGTKALADSAITFVSLAFACILVSIILTYYQPANDIVIYLCALCAIATLVWGFADKGLLQLLVYPHETGNELLQKSIPVRFCIGFLNISLMTAVTLLWKNLEAQKDEKGRKDDVERISREAELYKLRQQLHPHFLFNSLNSINALIHSRPDQARKMVQQLSEFLRGTLKREENQMVALGEEIQYLKLYLEIEKVRFGYRLKTTFDILDDALDCKMPPLILQPLMENAIKFGLYGTTGEVEIWLRARLMDHYLIVAVSNPYENDMQLEAGTGFGLKSIRRRLYLLYGRDDLMEINQPDNLFIVTFRIPQYNA